MKLILTVLLVLVAVSSVQARVIPADSMEEYLEAAFDELENFRTDLGALSITLTVPDAYNCQALCMTIKHARDITRNLKYLMVRAEPNLIEKDVYYKLAVADNISVLNSLSNCLQITLGIIDNSLAVVQGNDARKLITKIVTDCIDTITDERFKVLVLDYIELMESNVREASKNNR